jgi:hypothetical protein
MAAVAAAALSALIGIFAGVGFLILLMRAVACGLLVGAAVYGCILLLRKMIPELLAPVDETEESFDQGGRLAGSGEMAESQTVSVPQPGANLDIVLPGDDAEPDIFAPGGETFVPEPLSGTSAPRQPAVQTRAVFSSAPPAAVEELDDAILLEPEADSVAEPVISTNAAPERDGRGPGFDDLDILPDLDGFSDSFAAPESAAGRASGERADMSRPVLSEGSSSMRQGPASGMDPASLAQAVRTILKRDQKG